MPRMTPVLPTGFSEPTRAWFTAAFAEPTPAQAGAWDAIAGGAHALVVAPTGSGKTLAAFLWGIDGLIREPEPTRESRCRILYVSPLKALAVDIERNLRGPLAGIANEASRLGVTLPSIAVGVRSGDTPAAERRRLATSPPDILITTPESLFLLLTSRSRDALRGVRTVIVDELHALAGTKRGAHLAVSLERLDALLPAPAQRIGLSATVRPTEEAARFLGPGTQVVAPPSTKTWELSIRVPVDDLSAMGTSTGEVDGSAAGGEARTSIWPHLEAELLDLVLAHASTIVFANSRRLAERITARLNDLAAERGIEGTVARAHHGSVSREQRAIIEDDLKAGRLPAVVATSSLELGIDMGAVDLVVQVETPPSVASGLQRVGRAGHQVGAVSRGVLLPKFRGDLLTSAVVAERMRAGAIEELRIPQVPLDVLAQQIVAMAAMDDWEVGELASLLRRSAPFATLTDAVLASVLDMLAGRYPSDEFAELRPRITWDRAGGGTLRGRPGAQRLAVTSGGTIPDRGLFGVFLVGERASRVGELDEEMVYESRVGDVIALGATSWRIEDITHDRVLVSPAPGQPGRLPFWHGDALGRPAELGAALGAFVRELASLPADRAGERLAGAGLDDRARANLLAYLAEQRAATLNLPDDRTLVVERFRDELGDWRVAVLSPFGARVHGPLALAVAARLREEQGIDPQVMHADDGIVLRLPDTDDDAIAASVAAMLAIEPEEIEGLVTDAIGGSSLFAARFREAAARALLLPKRRPDRRSPLWQQRQRAAHLLEVAARYPDFPIVLEAVRECLQDAYDVPALRALLGRIRTGEVRVVEVETRTPSPFARSLLFGYVATFLYEGDAPLAERRAQALTLDSALLAELLGSPELRDLLDPEAIAEIEAELQHLRTTRVPAPRDAEDAADLLRILGPLSDDQARERGIDAAWLAELITSRRAIAVRIAGTSVTAAIEDASRLRDALGTALPPGVPEAFLAPVADPVGDLVSRFARTHGPFALEELVTATGLAPAVARDACARAAATGRLVRGAFRPDGTNGTNGTDDEWCDAGVLRRIRRRSVARLRHDTEPVEPRALGAFLPAWQHIAPVGTRPRLHGMDGLLTVVEQLAGTALPASAWERTILPARIDDYSPALLDEAMASGEVTWWGAGQLAGNDGAIALAPADLADAVRGQVDRGDSGGTQDPVALALLDGLAAAGPRAAFFFRDLADLVGARLGTDGIDDRRIEAALWDLAWAGRVTTDTWAALRARGAAGLAGRTPRARTRRRIALPTRSGPPTAAGRWSLLPEATLTAESRASVIGELLLARHGLVTRGAVVAERIPGGYAAAIRVLSAFEDAGRCQRAYAVEGLGAAQFAVTGVVDRLRAAPEPAVHVLAAVDPANAYGAALPWPAMGGRPGRKAGSFVAIVDGSLAAYLERGGRTLATAAGMPEGDLARALAALADATRAGTIPRMRLEAVDGESVSPASLLGTVLTEAGLVHSPAGWGPR